MLRDGAYFTSGLIQWINCRKGVLLTNKLKLLKSERIGIMQETTWQQKELENPAEIVEAFKYSWRLPKKFWDDVDPAIKITLYSNFHKTFILWCS